MIRKILTFLILTLLLTPLAWIYTSLSVSQWIYRDIESIPEKKIGILLGTSQYLVGGGENLFFSTRIDATKELYESKKISHILISGDNSNIRYNEPESMKKALMKAGIPEEDITLDYAGFRTLDSILRARDIFGVTDGVIISQPFHVERAVYLARANHIPMIGYGSRSIPLSIGTRVYIRELGARWGAVYDALSGREALVGGKEEKITIDTENTESR